MKSLHFIALLHFSFLLNGQITIEAYINDKDGYTNVRKGQSTDNEVVAVIRTAELFKCEPNKETGWWRVWKEDGTEGYIHQSRIILINEKKNEIQSFFKKIRDWNPSDVEFSQGSNEKLFIDLEQFPKAFLMAIDESNNEIRRMIIAELESPIHDLIDLKLIYKRISSIQGLEETKSLVAEAIIMAGEKINLDVTK